MENKKPYGTVLIKASKVLDYLIENPDISPQTVVKGAGMISSTVLEILDTLLMIDYVNKDSRKSYRLDAKLICYTNKNVKQTDLAELTLPFLEQLQQKINETIHLGVLNNDEILYVNKPDPEYQTTRMSPKIGVIQPLYNSTMGKAVLVKFSEEQYTGYLEKYPLTPYTEYMITNALRLKKGVQTVKEAHITLDDEEIKRDILCIEVSIVKNEQAIGAFSVNMSRYRLADETKERIISVPKQTKSEIGRRIQKQRKEYSHFSFSVV